MAEMPKRPDKGESTLLNGAPPAWENVAAPVFRGTMPVEPLPPPPLPPPPVVPSGQAGYRPVYDGGVAAGARPSVYGGQQAQGYSQNNYGQPNVAEMLAMATLMPRRRRVGRHVVFWMMLCFGMIAMALLHGCIGFLRIL